MATESIGTLIPTAIPGYTDSADIQAALRAYHYGSYAYDPANTSPGSLVTPSIAKTIYDIQADITTLENRPSSGGEVDATQPAPGDFTPPEIPDGFIWVDSDGTVGGQPTSATSVFTNSAPTSSLTTGVIWVDKDPTSITVNPFIPQTIIGAKGDIVVGTANDTASVLNAGTNGFVLSANSATTSGLEWVAQDDSNAIQNSIVAAKGDIIGASANDVPAITSVGANGETLVADSSTAAGLRWQAPVNANPFLNSAFEVWQRGTPFAVSGSASYTADRWQAISAAYTAGLTVSRQATSDTTNLPSIQYCARVQRDSGNTSTAQRNLQQCFESVNSIPYAGKTVTLSFYARKGADFSAAGSNLVIQWAQGTGTDENLYLSGYTGGTNLTGAVATATLTTTWQRFTYTATVATTTTEIALNFYFNGVGTAGANDYFEITGVQMEVGSVATPFKTYAGTIQGELAACQRYYYQTESSTKYLFSGFAYSSTIFFAGAVLPATMRTNPTLVTTGTGGDYRVVAGGTFIQASTIPTLETATVNQVCIRYTVAGGLTTGFGGLGNGNNSNAFLGFNAEL